MDNSGFVHSFRLVKNTWLLGFLGSLVASLVVVFAPDTLIELAGLRSEEMTELARRILQILRLPIWLVPLGSLGLAAYFSAAEKQARSAPRREVFTPPESAAPHWNTILILLAVGCLIFWIIPIGDGLQDDEADKLRVAVWGWDYWLENLFNTRVNILPITLTRLVYSVTQNRVEWQLRLPLLLVFGLSLLYMFGVSFRKRYSPQTSALLLIFFGLSGIMGAYASKVQGYLAALAFSTAGFILWTDVIRGRGNVFWRGIGFTLCCLGAFLSHNFTLFFLLGLLGTTLLREIANRYRGKVELGITAASGFMSMAIIGIGVTAPLGIRSILAHIGLGEARGTRSYETFYSAVVPALTGTSQGYSLLLILSYLIALFILWRLANGRYSIEMTLAILSTLGVSLFYWILSPRFFIDRFMIWLPLTWLLILGEGSRVLIERLRILTRFKGFSYALGGVLFTVILMPSQISWQEARTSAVNLRMAAEAGKSLADTYGVQDYTVGYLLLRSYGNYSHRMWFYFPEHLTVSDRDSSATLEELRRAIPCQVWIIPAPRNELSGEYARIPAIAVEYREAGNVTLYVVFDESLEATHNTAQIPET